MESKLFSDDDLIPLSRLQHVMFCPRQFALIHVEQVWQENRLTSQGRVIHDNAHDPFFSEKRGDTITTRSVPVVSYKLGVSGECDVVEWQRSESGVTLEKYDGLWMPTPVEYKRGKPKKGAFDEVHLCAQAMCIEEMLNVIIPKGFLYYWEIRSRVEVIFGEELRGQVCEAAKTAQRVIKEETLPPPDRPKSQCRNCSLLDECMPGSKTKKSAAVYIRNQVEEMING